MNKIQENYLKAEIETASPAKLILLLYNGLLSSLNRAQKEIEAKHLAEAHRFIMKSQDIVTELSQSLNRTEGGEIADNLFRLYDFMYETLVKANFTKDTALLNQISLLALPLRDAWEQSLLQKN